MVHTNMWSLGIMLFLSHAAVFLFAKSLEPKDCITAEQFCFNSSQCKSSYHLLKNCSRTHALVPENAPECREAARVIFQTPLMHCKCQRRMKREEICLNIYWTVHPQYLHGYLDLYNSPYNDDELDTTKELDILYDSLSSEWNYIKDSTNECLKEANVCSLDRKCSLYKNNYVMHCNSMYPDGGSCDRSKCHEHLRNFFKRVPMAFTKRFLFCPCHHDSDCAERRRQNIVPKCSFEEKGKKNCLHFHDSCMKNNICKSRLLDYRKQCHLFDNKKESCPPEQYNRCILSYIGMIGTVMTPNFINNSSMDMSIWCTCEGSSNNQDECTAILAMFTSNRCLYNAINQSIPNKEEAELTIPVDGNDDTSLSVLAETDQVSERDGLFVLAASGRLPTGTASSVFSSSLGFILLNPTFIWWLLNVL